MKDLKDKKILFVTFIVLLLILTTSLSYAYFSTSVSGNDNAKDVVVETGTLKLVYTDSPEIVAEHIKPGWSTTKVVTVKNTGTLDTAYNLVWQELVNEISNDELVISASCERLNSSNMVEGTCEGLDETVIGESKIKTNISIESGITHKYTFTITFKEINSSQDYNQNKKFNGVIGVEEYKETTTNCTFDGELVQGAEYTHDGYTYRYKQEGKYITYYALDWQDMDMDGWGVQQTDKASGEDATGKLCSSINGKPVVSMKYMFANSRSSKIDVSSFDTSNVTNMRQMFYSVNADIIGLNSFITSNVIDMSEMFISYSSDSLDVSSFDTSKVTNMNGMFTSSRVATLDLSNFDTSRVTDMGEMFSNSQASVIDVSSFDTNNVTNMSKMFYSSQVAVLDLSNFDTSKVTDINNIFRQSANLKTIYASNKFIVNSSNSDKYMFYDCTSLVGGLGTTYHPNNVSSEYAKIDGGTSSPGYFTSK